MGVQSYLALYTILLGWQEYDALWHMMVSLGLIALPFAFIAYRAFKGPILSMGAKDAGVIATRRFIFNIITALLILLFVGVPSVNLQPQMLHFKPAWSGTTKTAHPGDTGTTYDDLLPVPPNVKVPIFWYVILAFSNGITNQAIDTITSPAVNLRSLQS
jgi:cbb3-type cytochrome oxidase subunit 3